MNSPEPSFEPTPQQVEALLSATRAALAIVKDMPPNALFTLAAMVVREAGLILHQRKVRNFTVFVYSVAQTVLRHTDPESARSAMEERPTHDRTQS